MSRTLEFKRKVFNKVNDNIKRDYCKINKIKLLEIPYWEFDNIENILSKYLGGDANDI